MSLIGARSEELGDAEEAFLGAVPNNYQWRAPQTGPTNYNGDASETAKTETRRRVLVESVKDLTVKVINLEVHLGVTTRWQPGDQQYEDTRKYIATRNYQQALGRLQRLVIQRLFELHRLNVAQTGMRLLRHCCSTLTSSQPTRCARK